MEAERGDRSIGRTVALGFSAMPLIYIALGSAAGGVSRYALGGLVQRLASGSFPVGTLVVNLTGSLLLGFLLRFAVDSPAVTPELRALLGVGFCGGYTTFSTFGAETIALLQAGDWRRATLYIVLSVLGALAATAAGFVLARELVAFRMRP
jgi:CrcB protein